MDNNNLEDLKRIEEKRIKLEYGEILRKQIIEKNIRKEMERKRRIEEDLKLERDNENYFRYKRNQQLQYQRHLNYQRSSSELNENYPNIPIFQSENDENNSLNLTASSNEEEENNNEIDESSEESNQVNPNYNTIIENLPVNEINDVNNLEDNKKSCVICMDNFKNGDNIISLPCIFFILIVLKIDFQKRILALYANIILLLIIIKIDLYNIF